MKSPESLIENAVVPNIKPLCKLVVIMPDGSEDEALSQIWVNAVVDGLADGSGRSAISNDEAHVSATHLRISIPGPRDSLFICYLWMCDTHSRRLEPISSPRLWMSVMDRASRV